MDGVDEVSRVHDSPACVIDVGLDDEAKVWAYAAAAARKLSGPEGNNAH